MREMWDRFTGTVRTMWATGRGRVAIIVTGVLALLVVASMIALNVMIPATVAEPQPTVRTPAAPSEELFPDASVPTQKPGGAPVIMDNGQVDIGGPGIPANIDGWVEPEKPEAAPDRKNGLAEWPAEVPAAKLTVPAYDDVPVAECFASQVPEARAIANEIIAYLFTWDTSKASFGQWAAPVHWEWHRLYGYYGGEGSNGKGDTGELEDRLESIGVSESAWARWAQHGVRSNVRVNQVTTTAPYSLMTKLTYTVTITRSGDGIDEEYIVENVDVFLTAPCASEGWPAEAAKWDMTGLQLFDVRGWAGE